MGYTTDFEGQFNFNKPLDDETFNLLKGLADTRRMGRNIEGYGTEGEFYIVDDSENVINYNQPPSTQPSLWLQWTPTEDRQSLEWDGGEKFYKYTEWLEYLIKSVLEPKGYVLNGEVIYRGEDFDDVGIIVIEDNKVTNHKGIVKKPVEDLKLDIEEMKKKDGKLIVAIIGDSYDKDKFYNELIQPLVHLYKLKIEKRILDEGTVTLSGKVGDLASFAVEVKGSTITRANNFTGIEKTICSAKTSTIFDVK